MLHRKQKWPIGSILPREIEQRVEVRKLFGSQRGLAVMMMLGGRVRHFLICALFFDVLFLNWMLTKGIVRPMKIGAK